MSSRLRGKRALVTGAASGIGLACAATMAAEGATVLMNDIGEVGAEQSAVLNGTSFQRLDVTSEADWVQAVAAVPHLLGGLDILVNNAGIGIAGDITTMSLQDWRRQQAVNLDGTFLGIKHALPLIRASGGGSVINVASVTGIKGSAPFFAYAASKAGVIALTRSVARACAGARDGVRVNAVAPGVIDTPIFGRLEGLAPGSSNASVIASTLVPLGRAGQPQDVAAGVVYLASDESRYVTGTTLVIDGGLAMA